MKRKNKTILALSLCAGLAIGVGAVSTVENVKTASAEGESFYVFDGASIRLSNENMGIRFEAFLSESAKTAVESGAEFGMLVMSEENYNKSTDWLNDYANNDKVKKFVYGVSELGTNDGEQEEDTTAYPVRVRAAITNLQFDSANQDLVAVGYLKNGDSIVYDSSYNTPLADGADGARSIAQVAELARKAYDEAVDKTEFNFGAVELAWLDEMVQKGYANDQGMDYNGTEYVLGTDTYEDWKTPFVNQIAIYDGETEVSEVTLQKAVVVDGDITEKQLTAKLVNFGKDTDADFTWTVNGEAVTVVDGKITFANVGTATVTATCGEYSASVVVNAEKSKIDASSITLTDLETWGTNEAGKTLVNVAPFTALNANGTTGAGETLALNLTDKAYTGDTKTAIDVEFDNAVYTGVQANLITKKISTVEELQKLTDYGTVVDNTAGNAPLYTFDGYFVLANNIDLTGKEITSTFDAGENKSQYGFIGTFDGRGYTILNGTYSGHGLFGQVGAAGVVKNVAFTNMTITSGCSGIANFYYGSMENVLLSMTEIYGATGIANAFQSGATFTNVVAYSTGTATNSHPYCLWAGNLGTYTNCYSISEDGQMSYTGQESDSVTKMTWVTLNKNTFTGFDSDTWVFNDDGTAYFKKIAEFYQPQLDAVDMSAVTSLKAGESVTIDGIPAGAVLSTDSEYVTVTGNNTLTVATNFTESFTCNVTLSMYGAVKTVELEVVYFDALIMEEQVYEIYTGLNGSERIENTAAFTVSLGEGKTVKTGGIWYLTNGANKTATDIVTADGNVITINRDNLAVGEYTLTYEHEEQSIKVPFILATKIIMQEDFANFKDYGEKTVVDFATTDGGELYKLDGYFVLGENIDASGMTFATPFTLAGGATHGDVVDTAGFIGTFNGRGYTVKGGTYTTTGVKWNTNGGLFGQVGKDGVIKNVAFLEANIGEICGVFGYAFLGTMQDVLITFKGTGGSEILGITAAMKTATLKNVVVYYLEGTTNANLGDKYTFAYADNNNTFENCYSISYNTNHSGAFCVSASGMWSPTAGSGLTCHSMADSVAFTGLSSDIWKIENGVATFVKANQ